MRFKGLLGAAYLVVGCVSFGHAAARADAYNERYVADCQARATEGLEPGDACSAYVLVPPTFSGIGAGVFWPLYWSWVAFEEARP